MRVVHVRLCAGAVVLGVVLAACTVRADAGPGPISSSGPGSGRGGGGGGSSHGNGRIVAVLPDGSLRELSTWFTQVTESPFTIPEGRLLVSEIEVSASSARLDTIRSRSVDLGGVGLALGLPNRWTLAATLDAWSGLGLTTGPVSGETNPGGFGGGALSARHTFFGVDSAGVAMGFLATVTLPASALSPRATSYGAAVAVPLSASLPLDVTLGAMTEVATLADVAGTGHHLRFVDSVKLERELVPHLSGWAEAVSIADREPGYAWLATVNGGLSAAFGKHVALSLGMAAGRTHDATDHGVFGGVGLHL